MSATSRGAIELPMNAWQNFHAAMCLSPGVEHRRGRNSTAGTPKWFSLLLLLAISTCLFQVSDAYVILRVRRQMGEQTLAHHSKASSNDNSADVEDDTKLAAGVELWTEDDTS